MALSLGGLRRPERVAERERRVGVLKAHGVQRRRDASDCSSRSRAPQAFERRVLECRALVREARRVSSAERWTVYGRVFAPRLPEIPLRCDGVEIRPLVDDRDPLFAPSTMPQLQAVQLPHGGWTPAPYVRVQSEWVLSVVVDAEGPEEAFAEADARSAILLTAIDLIGGQPARAHLVAAAAPDGRSFGRESGGMMFGVPVEPLDPSETGLVVKRCEATAADETACAAARSLRDGLELLDVGVSNATVVGAGLLNVFKAIELISAETLKAANAPMGGGAAEIIMKLNEQLIASGLTERSPSFKVQNCGELIDKAAVELRRRRYATLPMQVEKAGQVLGVTEDDVQCAKRFAQFRNTRLGHGRSANPSLVDLAPWTASQPPRAYALATAYLTCYLDRQGTTTSMASPPSRTN